MKSFTRLKQKITDMDVKFRSPQFLTHYAMSMDPLDPSIVATQCHN